MALPGILQRLLDHINTRAAHGLAVGRNFSVSGGAVAAPVAFDGTGDVNLVVTSLDMSKMTGGVLPTASGGTGRTDGKSPAWITPRTLTLFGEVLGSAVFDGSGDINLSARVSVPMAPRPQAAEGAGQWMLLPTTKKGSLSYRYILPSGGTWVWVALVATASEYSTTYSLATGLGAGETDIHKDGYCGVICWRIA